MLINIKTKLSAEELDGLLSTKACIKYPHIFRVFSAPDRGVGINWVKSKSSFICLFYEDGGKGSRGELTPLRSFFYGRVIRTKGCNRIVGIACWEIILNIISLLIYGEIILQINGYNFDLAFVFFFLALVLIIFNASFHKANQRIRDYLEKQFT